MASLGTPTPSKTRATPDALARAVHHLASLQHEPGYFEAEMVWNTMLLSQWVIVQHIVHAGQPRFTEVRRRHILRHYEITRLADGSWPMHGEGHGYVFFTTLAYVALRMMGVPPSDPLIAPARTWLRERGVLSVPSWGKFWLSMLGLYEYEGMNPVPPELFLVPDSLPIHPNNYYNHTRYIYLGIGYLYGKRFRHELGDLRDELRAELYTQAYESIDFAAHRHDIAESDRHVRPSLPLRVAYDALVQWERAPSFLRDPVRKRALDLCFGRIEYEVQASRRQGLSPVNGLLNCLALYSADAHHPELEPSLAAMESWAWEDDHEGLRFCGAHSTAWDTAFCLRAFGAAAMQGALSERAATTVRRAYAWLVQTQMQEELPDHERERRAPIRGGWCFSDGVHRWPVSDCTAEALTGMFAVEDAGIVHERDRLSAARVEEAIEFILRRQNEDGGFGSYEARRAGALLELVNPSEMYGNCMTERSYTECSASCVGALVRWLARRGGSASPLASRVEQAVDKAVKLLRTRQREDGAYLGFWGVNFTYGIFHVVEALVASRVDKRDPAIARAVDWLVEHQKTDGGWGEHWKSMLSEKYEEHPESQPAMTAWALLALHAGGRDDERIRASIARGRAYLLGAQDDDGSWPHKAQSGVFFSTAMLDYRLYKDVFTTWALAETVPGGSTASPTT